MEDLFLALLAERGAQPNARRPLGGAAGALALDALVDERRVRAGLLGDLVPLLVRGIVAEIQDRTAASNGREEARP